MREGLAQYYTPQLVYRLEDRVPEPENAYQTLLLHQPQEYQVQEQEQWIEDRALAENIRRAMVVFRRSRASTLKEFESFLDQAKHDLGCHHRAPTPAEWKL